MTSRRTTCLPGKLASRPEAIERRRKTLRSAAMCAAGCYARKAKPWRRAGGQSPAKTAGERSVRSRVRCLNHPHGRSEKERETDRRAAGQRPITLERCLPGSSLTVRRDVLAGSEGRVAGTAGAPVASLPRPKRPGGQKEERKSGLVSCAGRGANRAIARSRQTRTLSPGSP